MRQLSRVVVATAMLSIALLGGCQVIGVAVENYRKDATRTIPAECVALQAKSFAAIVTADRAIQGDFPMLTEVLTAKVTERLSNPANLPAASGFVPARDVLRYIYENPSWGLRTKSDVARSLGGVDLIIVLELLEYRLHDPGNPYVWDAMASATMSVYDPTSPTPEIAVFEKPITVRFPDKRGMGPEDMNASLVSQALTLRLIDRATWLFYEHEEPYYPTY
ncbi:MAG: hypothetical protein HBSAPP03_16880 [Phycisphaerae bacterium]|nr:MAG: hypothetical protein HBSAPP03_16880 [Phycisphaerae bacterium]